MLRLCMKALAIGALHLAMAAPALADAYPSKPIRWVVGYPPGSGLDFVSRVVAESLAKKVGQPIVIDNRPGAAGAIAASSLSQAPADGYTLLSVDMGAYTLNPHLYTKLTYDPRRDFRMVGPMVTIPMVLYVPSSLNVDNVKDFVRHVKSQPSNKLTFGSSGTGNPTHLTMEMFKRAAGLEMVHAPYRGSNLVFPDLMAGTLQAFFTGPADGMPHVQAGKLKALATATPERVESLSHLPTLRESGFDVHFPVWLAMGVSANTPPEVVKYLNQSLNEVMSQPDLVKRLQVAGYAIDKRLGAKETDDFARAEYDRWGKALAPMNMRLD